MGLQEAYARYLEALRKFEPDNIPLTLTEMDTRTSFNLLFTPSSEIGRLHNVPLCWREVYGQAGLVRTSLQNALAWNHGHLQDLERHNASGSTEHLFSSGHIDQDTHYNLIKEIAATAIALWSFRERIGWLVAAAVPNTFSPEEIRWSLGEDVPKEVRKTAREVFGFSDIRKVSFKDACDRLEQRSPDHPAIAVLHETMANVHGLEDIEGIRHDIIHNFFPSIDIPDENFQVPTHEYEDGKVKSTMLPILGISPPSWNSQSLLNSMQTIWKSFVKGAQALSGLPGFHIDEYRVKE